ncbi:hypothetical protein PMIN02_010555 [Paraphaeosphaeria minitans]|uniref:Uncharacterized protein n=1 Tax=Paraphaeosphaeria minitans TaxID=565426 RepID=A0A9P6KNN0_9PLEO|nr:hypothetical protein PMIN01_08121 [Paraphaeosphaeria minitans]
MSTSNDQSQSPQQGEAVATDGYPHPLRSHPVTTGGGTTSSTVNTVPESSDQPTLLSAYLAQAGEEDQRELEAAWEAAASREPPPTPAPSLIDCNAPQAPDNRNNAMRETWVEPLVERGMRRTVDVTDVTGAVNIVSSTQRHSSTPQNGADGEEQAQTARRLTILYFGKPN